LEFTMQRTTKFAAATFATLAVAAASAVFAFPGPGMGPGFGPGFGPMAGGPGTFGPGARFAGGDMTAFADQRMGELKSELKITAAQEPAWQAFTGKAKQQAQTMQANRTKMQEAGGPTPDRMAQRSEFMKQRLAGMESMNAAMKDLYAVLTPEQKAVADQRFGHAGGPRMPFGPRGG
jgi:Spy/CpxP family protein refolding chaperone